MTDKNKSVKRRPQREPPHEGATTSAPLSELENDKLSHDKKKDLSSFLDSHYLWFLLIGFRIANSLAVQTFEMPDEFYQSVEVAHLSAFGYGHLTWEWKLGLRSYFYPMIFSIPLKLLAVLHLDYWQLVIKIPKIVQAVFAASADYYLFKLSRAISGPGVAKWALICQLISWYMLFMSTRTFSNNFEAFLTILAFYFYYQANNRRKETRKKQQDWLYLIFVSLSFAIRPPAIIQFFPLICHHAFRICFLEKARNFAQKCWTILRLSLTGLSVIMICVLIDSLYYEKWTVTFYNFIYFNLVAKVSHHYGVAPWFWYLTEESPTYWGNLLYPLVIGFCRSREWPLLHFTIIWTVFAYSCIAHKEFRFLAPVMPLAMHFAGAGMHLLWQQAAAGRHKVVVLLGWCWNAVLAYFLAQNLWIAYYESMVNYRGAIDVMWTVRKHAEGSMAEGKEPSVLFLTPCYSTPFYSHVHLNITMRMFTCDPELPPSLPAAKLLSNNNDEFFADPKKWLDSNYPKNEADSLPTLIVMFDKLVERVAYFIESRRYYLCSRVFNTHIMPPDQRSNTLLAFCLNTTRKN